MAQRDWNNARKLLCVRLDSLGDVLMTTPALRALKHQLPGRQITLLTSPAGAAVAQLVPEIDRVLVYDAPWLKATAPREDSNPEYAMAEELRSMCFDGTVIFTVYSQNPLPSAFLCFLADIPRRLAHCRENPYQLLTDWVAEPEPAGGIRHEVRRQLDLVATIGASTRNEHLSLRVPAAAHARAERLLVECGIDVGRPWLVIHPGASAPSRRYPAERFAQAADTLIHEHSVQVVFTGDVGEAALIAEVQASMQGYRAPSLAGQLTLAELSALIMQAPLLISNNTGPAHIAAAVGTPVVDLYALTNPQHTPWGVLSRVLFADVPCRNCYKSVCPQRHHHCLRGVMPGTVVAAALELLAETRTPGIGSEAASIGRPMQAGAVR